MILWVQHLTRINIKTNLLFHFQAQAENVNPAEEKNPAEEEKNPAKEKLKENHVGVESNYI